MVVERYRDSQALLEHFANLGETAAVLFETCSASGELSVRPAEARKPRYKIIGSDIAQTGAIRAVIDQRYPLSLVPAALTHLEQGHVKGKVVITI